MRMPEREFDLCQQLSQKLINLADQLLLGGSICQLTWASLKLFIANKSSPLVRTALLDE